MFTLHFLNFSLLSKFKNNCRYTDLATTVQFRSVRAMWTRL